MDPVKTTINTYNLIAQDYSDSYFDYYLNELEYIDEFLDLLPPKGKVLDAGCGPGGISKHLIEKGFEAVGIDLSENMLQIAKAKVPKGDFRNQEIRNLNFPPDHFDGVIASYSLVHVPKKDILSTLTGFNRVSKLDGVLFISVHEGNGEKLLDEPFKPGEKIFVDYFSSEEMENYLSQTEFQVLEKWSVKTKASEEFITNELIFISKKVS